MRTPGTEDRPNASDILATWRREHPDHARLTRRALAIGALTVATAAGGQRLALARQQATPAASPAAGEATITTSFGEVTIPLAPARVVVMENTGDLEIALALGLPIVGVGVWGTLFTKEGEWIMPWIPATAEGITPFDTSESDLELVLALAPDLVISREYYLDPEYGYGYAGLSQIAPIIPVGSGKITWEEDLRRVAGWLQREAALAPVMADYDALLADVRTRHAATIATAKIAILRPNSPSELFINAELVENIFMDALRRLGGNFSDLMAEGSQMISIERVSSLADADAILVWGFEEDAHLLDDVAVWQQVPAVQQGQVVWAGAEMIGGNVFSAMAALRIYDELFTRLSAD